MAFAVAGCGWSAAVGHPGGEGNRASEKRERKEVLGVWLPALVPDHVQKMMPASGLAGGDDIRAGDVVRIVRL